MDMNLRILKSFCKKLRLLLEPHSSREEIRDIRISKSFIELDVGAYEKNHLF